MGLVVERVELLLLVAAVVSILARRLRLPYTVGLVAAGALIALLPITPVINLTKDLIFTTLLPPLIFEAAFHMSWKGLRKDLILTLTLATLGVLLSTALIAAGVHYLVGWSWEPALLLGVVLSATDPVSVIATFKEAGVKGRLQLLVEAESLLNDGTAVVLFGVAQAAILGGSFSAGGIGVSFFTTVFGGILCGALVGGLMLALVGHTQDHLVEIAFTTVAAYGSFLLAEHFHLSGVLATLTTGVLVGNFGALGTLTEQGREAVTTFWEFSGFVANSLIFLLIGARLGHHNFFAVWSTIVAVNLIVILGRALAVYPCCALFARSRWRVPMRHQHILFWGGLRGALALALVLGLPPDTPYREPIVIVTFAVVAFSIVVQGITMTPLLRRLGIIDEPPVAE